MHPFRIKLYKGNIIDLADKVDVIVNAAKPSLEGGSGVDGVIHAAAGPRLLEECRKIPGTPDRCLPGSVVATDGYNIGCKIFHTVGSKIGSNHKFTQTQAKLLRSCYKKCLAKCSEYDYKNIALPLIGSGKYNWDKEIAIRIAISEIHNYLLNNVGISTVYIVIINDDYEAFADSVIKKTRSYE